MSVHSSVASWKSVDVVSDQFPAGLRVLVVDDDPTCLRILEKMLRTCHYEVTTCSMAEVALSLLRENKNGFDIVLSDVHMPDMDGFKLLEYIGLEMDLPVIMMSADDGKHVVMKGVTHGACDYLIKPVRMEALKNIWQHVIRKKKHEWKDKDIEQSGSVEEGDRQQKPCEDVDYSSSANEGNWKSSKKRKDEEDEGEERDETSGLKKPRVVWSVELHQQFVAAVNQLGIDKAVPKKILEMMNVPGLTRENVASHLQKYRLYLRRLSGVSQHQSGLNSSFMGPPDPTFGAMSSLNGLDFQTLAATGQISAQSLASLQAAALGRSAPKPMPVLDQRNLFSFENPKFRFVEEQQQMNNNKRIGLLHGIPTNMEPKQLTNPNQSSQPFGNQFSRIPSSVTQPILSSELLARNGIVDNSSGGPVYQPVSQAPPLVDFSMNQNVEMQNNSFVSSNSGMSSCLSSKRMIPGEVNSDVKRSRGFAPGYDIFNDLQQHKPQDWGLQNVGPVFDASRLPNASPSVMVQHGFSSGQTGQQNGCVGQESVNVSNGMVGPQFNSLLGSNSITVKAERLPDTSYQNTLFSDQHGQDDLMSALLKQQESVGPVENEFGFDGYQLGNLPV